MVALPERVLLFGGGEFELNLKLRRIDIMTSIIIKTLYKLAVLYLTLAVLFLAALGIELTSYVLHIPTWVVWLVMGVIASVWAIVETVLERREGGR